MIHTWLQFTLNMEKSIQQDLTKFHLHKLKLTCSIDRMYNDTIAFHFHTNAKILLTVHCTSISTLLTFQCSICASPHQNMVYYTGHFKTYVILSFCRFFSSYECKNEKWPTCCGVYFRLYQNMSNFMINYESVSVRPLFQFNPQPDSSTFLLIQPKYWHFCDEIKLLDSCR